MIDTYQPIAETEYLLPEEGSLWKKKKTGEIFKVVCSAFNHAWNVEEDYMLVIYKDTDNHYWSKKSSLWEDCMEKLLDPIE